MHSEDIISAVVLALVCAVLVDICQKAIIQYRNKKQTRKYCLDAQKLIKFKTYDQTANNKAIQIALKGNASHKDMVELSDAIMKNSSHLSEIILSSYNKIK